MDDSRPVQSRGAISKQNLTHAWGRAKTSYIRQYMYNNKTTYSEAEKSWAQTRRNLKYKNINYPPKSRREGIPWTDTSQPTLKEVLDKKVGQDAVSPIPACHHAGSRESCSFPASPAPLYQYPARAQRSGPESESAYRPTPPRS